MAANMDPQIQNIYLYDNLSNKLYTEPHFKEPPNHSLLTHIKTNFESIKLDDHELLTIHNKIMHKSTMIKNILTYELLYYVPQPSEQIETVQELSQLLISLLQRFQGVVGGFGIEDMQWILHNTTSTRFLIEDKTLVLANTTTKVKLYDGEISKFMDNVIDYASRYIKNENLCINAKIINDYKNEIYWICIIIDEFDDSDSENTHSGSGSSSGSSSSSSPSPDLKLKIPL